MEHLAGGLHSVAEALLMFLESLREPVIPYKYYNKCLECANNFTLCKQVWPPYPLDSHDELPRRVKGHMSRLCGALSLVTIASSGHQVEAEASLLV